MQETVLISIFLYNFNWRKHSYIFVVEIPTTVLNVDIG